MARAHRFTVTLTLAMGIALGLLARNPFSRAVADPSGSAQPAALKIATVNTYDLLAALLDADRYATPRTENEQSWLDKIKDLAEALQSLEARIGILSDQEPEKKLLIDQYQQKQAERQKTLAQARQETDAFKAKQIGKAFAEILAAADAVADEGGFTLVISRRSPTSPWDSVGVNSAIQEILARPLLRETAAQEITGPVAEKLGITLEDKAEGQ